MVEGVLKSDEIWWLAMRIQTPLLLWFVIVSRWVHSVQKKRALRAFFIVSGSSLAALKAVLAYSFMLLLVYVDVLSFVSAGCAMQAPVGLPLDCQVVMTRRRGQALISWLEDRPRRFFWIEEVEENLPLVCSVVFLVSLFVLCCVRLFYWWIGLTGWCSGCFISLLRRDFMMIDIFWSSFLFICWLYFMVSYGDWPEMEANISKNALVKRRHIVDGAGFPFFYALRRPKRRAARFERKRHVDW